MLACICTMYRSHADKIWVICYIISITDEQITMYKI